MQKSNHKGRKAQTVPEVEQIARYGYLVRMLPRDVAVKAHAAAFTDLSADQRIELIDALRPFVPEAEREAAADGPDVFATVVRDPEPRDAMMRTRIAGAVASRFVQSAPVRAYFTVGVGSLTIDEQPLWVGELVAHESAPVDAGTVNHFKGVNSGVWF